MPYGEFDIWDIPIENLVRSCNWILIAEVQSVHEEDPKYSAYACVSVIKVWKGGTTKTPGDTINVVVAKADWLDYFEWSVTIGETDLLFVEANIFRPGIDVFQIAHFGRGRYPVRLYNGIRYAEVREEIILPKGIPMVSGLDPNRPSTRFIELSILKDIVMRIMDNHPKLSRDLGD